jgi:hypothetical protein
MERTTEAERPQPDVRLKLPSEMQINPLDNSDCWAQALL